MIVRKDMLQVADKKTGPLATFRKTDPSAPYDLAGLSTTCSFVKSKYPDKTEATILLEKDIPYDTLVQVMDTVRILEQRQDNQLVQAELFPERVDRRCARSGSRRRLRGQSDDFRSRRAACSRITCATRPMRN